MFVVCGHVESENQLKKNRKFLQAKIMQNIETFDYEMNKEENVVSIQHSAQPPSDSFLSCLLFVFVSIYI